MENWNNGIMENWNNGIMEYCKKGIMEDWKTGRLEYWNNGIIGKTLQNNTSIFQNSIISGVRFINDNLFGAFIIIFTAFFLCSGYKSPVNAQTLPNLDVFFKLADSSITEINNNLSPGSKKIFISHSLVNDYMIFQSRIFSGIKGSNREILTDRDSSNTGVIYSIENASVKYSDVYRDGLFGDYKVKRELSLKGNFLISENGILKTQKSFLYTSYDTINYNDISVVENQAFPFTKGEVPAEPFFSSLIEPVVAVGSAAVAVYLFFTVRSK